MKKLMLLVTLFTTLTNAHAYLREGSFEGRWQDGDDRRGVVLMLREAPGRAGSFYGVVVEKEYTKLAFYLIEPRSAGQYGMVPFQLSYDGEISIDNDNPSLVLTDFGRGNNVNWRVSSANTGNNIGFSGTMTIDNHTDCIVWRTPLAGRYDVEGHMENALNIAAFDTYEGEARAVFTYPQLSGNYVLREKLSGLFSINANSAFASGDEVSRTPRKIGIFVQKKNFVFYHDYLILASPSDSSDVIVFKRH